MNDPDMGYWEYKHNALGELKEQIDAKGQSTTFEYDSLGRKIKKTQGPKVSTWSYDIGIKAVGKLQKETSTNGSEKSYSYDEKGRISSETTILNGRTFTRSFAYDEYGRLDYVIEPNNFKLMHSYNEYGFHYGIKTQLDQIIDFDEAKYDSLISDAINEEIINYKKYIDLKVEIAEVERKLTEYKNAYSSDEYNSIITDINLAISKMKVLESFYKDEAQKSRDKLEYLLTQGVYSSNETMLLDSRVLEYDNLAQNVLNEITYSQNDISIVNTYILEWNGLTNELVKAKSTYENSVNEVEGEKNKKYTTSDKNFKYYYKVIKKDAFGRDIEFKSGNQTTTKEEYDYSGLLNSTKTGYNSDGRYLRELNYEYDENDNVILREDVRVNVIQEFEYDSLDRLKSMTSSLGNITYEYDELGNIKDKSDVGYYTYSSSSPHQVIQAGDKTFEYDLNGNMTNNDGIAISYNYANKPIRMQKGNSTVNFKYDMNESRFEKKSNGTTTQYVGKSYEYITHDNGNIEEKYFIYANGRVAATESHINSGTAVTKKTLYLHYDNLGSVDAITNDTGDIEQRFVYKPFGNKTTFSSNGSIIDNSEAKTNRGYTGHEHIDEFNFIHMNGRVYDPIIGRFLSADPHIQSPYDTQSFNRYTYVKNNPLKYTDPSGFFFKKLKKFIKPIIAIAVGVLTAGLAVAAYMSIALNTAFSFSAGLIAVTSGVTASIGAGAVIAAGAAMGFTSGAILTGSFEGALKGAAFGAISAGIANGIGDFVQGLNYGTTTNEVIRASLHGLTRSAITKAQGGRWSSGFWSGVASSAFAPIVGKHFGKAHQSVQTAISGVLAGTISVISGGKFANGAVTGAFTYMFNYSAHEGYMKKALGDPDTNGITVGINNIKNKISQWYAKNKESIVLSVKVVNSTAGVVTLVSAQSGQFQIAGSAGLVAIGSEIGLIMLGQKGVIEVSMAGFIDLATEKGPFYLKVIGELAKASNGALLNGK